MESKTTQRKQEITLSTKTSSLHFLKQPATKSKTKSKSKQRLSSKRMSDWRSTSIDPRTMLGSTTTAPIKPHSPPGSPQRRSPHRHLSPKSKTPMGRAAQRFPTTSSLRQTPFASTNTSIQGAGIVSEKLRDYSLGIGIQATALKNSTQIVDTYIKQLFKGNNNTVPQPIPPILFGNGLIDQTAGGGLITMAEHQHVLATVLRDYTNRLSTMAAFRESKIENHSQQTYIKKLKNRLLATMAAFRESKIENHSQQTYIKNLLSERDGLKMDLEKFTNNNSNNDNNNSNSNSNQNTNVMHQVPGAMHSPARQQQNQTITTVLNKSTSNLELDGAATRWKTPEPSQTEADDLLNISRTEKTIESVQKDVQETILEGTEIERQIDGIVNEAKSASQRVRADMRIERNHAVKMRKAAISSVQHSILELETSNLEQEEKDEMLSSLNSSLSELESSGFQASRRGSFVPNVKPRI